MNEVLRLVRKNIINLAPYSTARDEYKGKLGVFLDANENPFENRYNRYPDPRQLELKGIISAIKGVPVENMFLGNGSDEAIDLCFRVFCTPGKDNAVAIAPSYGMYRVAADINDVEVREVQLGEDFSLPVDSLLASCDENTKLMFICSPNNPSGNSFPMEQMLALADAFNGVLVVDEAYIDFANQPSLLTVLPKYKNLIVLQTLSKAYGLAGLRLGLAFADAEIMSIFAKVKYPYNINLAGMERAKELLARDVNAEIELLKSERERVAAALEQMQCVEKVFPSDANFLLVRVNDARGLYNALIEEQVIVRDRSRIKGCEGTLRITIGKPEENDRMLAIVDKWK
ncbi:MAG: histidinol-phosphate transaminase [Bacteroidaceae bacterium]|nr:histidinol-phosphate transaminase [Bacteroidaceae bacterium]